MAASDRAIASMIIDSIDDNGMSTTSLEDICASLIDPARESDEQPTLEDVETVLHKIQQFDPVGVGARDLRECLLLQLAQLDAQTPWLDEATALVVSI